MKISGNILIVKGWLKEVMVIEISKVESLAAEAHSSLSSDDSSSPSSSSDESSWILGIRHGSISTPSSSGSLRNGPFLAEPLLTTCSMNGCHDGNL